MAGKISEAGKNLKIGNKVNSNFVKISSSKSILSYQNGSALNIENREETGDEGLPGDGYSEEMAMPQEPFSEDQNLKSKCLDLLRKKLISDLSLTVFSLDLENKLAKMEPTEISKERQSVIQKLLIQISQLSDAEKLLLYLKLPSSTSSPFDPLRQPLNPLGNRQEIQQTIVWIKTHLEEDSEISIPKQDVYDQYLKYCENVSMKPLSTADFGKVMKQVYPGVRPRRLGTRGNSRYCYSGMRNTCKLPTPVLPRSGGENSVSNGTATDGPSLSLEASKYKKQDKGKRKLKSTICRSEKSTTLNRSSEVEKDSNEKNVKRQKVEEKEVTDSKEEDTLKEKVEKSQGNLEQIKEEIDLCGIKCEESSDNSFNTFEIECELDSDFGIYLKNVEKVAENSRTRSSLVSESPSGVETENKQNEFQKMLFNRNDSQTLNVDQTNKSISEGNLFSPVGNQTEKTSSVSNHPGKVNGLDGPKEFATNQRKPAKNRARRSASLSKPAKNLRKSYVPIQPKPLDVNKLNVRFEQPVVGMSQFPLEQKQESEVGLCEESDSQEPEEEIVRYFKHLDGNDMKTENLINQAVKNINNPTVQNSSLPQIISQNSVTGCRKNEAVNQQIWRSQSCFEVQRQLFSLGENVEAVHVPRSQSSVELPMSVAQEGSEPEGGSGGKTKKISHLRILLEKSISTGGRLPYSGLRESSNVLSGPLISTAQMGSTVSQPPLPNEPNCLLSPGKLIDRDLLKLNSLKILSSGPSYVPQSPNNRTKYFSFTPISPGPQSPLKTPSTPSASPFVSPRSTPGPRSKQNFSNDFFVSPSERKSTLHGKNEFFNENDFNFSKVVAGNFRNKPAAYLQACRPRSFSSTNFCRSKTRRNSSKLVDHETNIVTPNRVEAAGQNNFLPNSQFLIHKNFVSSDCLSNEVRKFLENNSTVGEDRSSTIRSQSVPLNRMISESSWVPAQVSSVYPGYFGSGTSNPTIGAVTSEWTSNSDTNSPKDITANVSPFLTNGEMNNVESGGLNNEVFSEDPTIAQLDQYFSGDFRPANEDNFQKTNPFQEESAFSNKLDLNSAETFESPFTSESDPSITYNIKSYLPDFDELENKNLDGEEGEKKMMKTPLYGRGNDNVKDPVITSFKPVITNEMCSCPGSPVLSFFGNKINEDNQQLIEFFDFED